MTKDEARAEMTQFSVRRSHLQSAITTAARAVIPVLLDAGRANSAKELQELFLQLDLIDRALLDFVNSDPKTAMHGLIGMMDLDRP